MGYNTVAVLYNDCSFADDVTLGNRIEQAMRSFNWPERHRSDLHFGKGVVISMAHADYTQIVAVGQNMGRPIQDCNDLNYGPLSTMAECLIRHGWTVKPPARKRAKSTALISEDGGQPK